MRKNIFAVQRGEREWKLVPHREKIKRMLLGKIITGRRLLPTASQADQKNRLNEVRNSFELKRHWQLYRCWGIVKRLYGEGASHLYF